MFVVRLLAPILGRTYDVLSSLALAAILLLLDQPLYLYNSGFLFSFGAVIGIAVVKPRLLFVSFRADDRRMKFSDDKEKDPFMDFTFKARGMLIEGVVTGVSIAIVTLPVYASFYYTYPLHSLFLNLLVIPLMSILMLAGIAAMLIGALNPVIGLIPGLVVHVILSFYKLISSSAAVNGLFTWYMGHSGRWQVAVYIGAVALFVMATKYAGDNPGKMSDQSRDRNYRPVRMLGRSFNGLFLADCIRFGILAFGIVFLTFHKAPDLEISMIDVGQGDGIVISSQGHNILIDGGSTSKKSVGKYQIIPFLKYKGIGKLDAAVVTHEDQDHISGLLEVFDDMEKGGIKVAKLILPEIAETSRGDGYHLLEKRANKLNVPILYINSGEQFTAGKASFICLNPKLGMTTDGANEYSTVLFMEYKEAGMLAEEENNGMAFTALFTGDVEGAGQEYLKSVIKNSPEKYSNLSLLKVAHHGSQYTTDGEFLELTHPKLAIISCGRDNSYGHPHSELIERLYDVGTTVFRTDRAGCVSIKMVGDLIKVEEYCK
jgi:competence protein ComEC